MPEKAPLEFNDKERKIKEIQGTSYSIMMYDEILAFTAQINLSLAEDKHMSSHLPITDGDIKNLELFKKVSDGKILAALINLVEPGSIDMRVLNTEGKSEAMKASLDRENIDLVLKTLNSIGVSSKYMTVLNMVEWKQSTSIILGLLWQVLKKVVLKKIDLLYNNNLARLLREGETLEDLKNLRPEELLKRWINYHLEKAGSSKRVKNFGSDLKDGLAYIDLLDHISGKTSGLKKYVDESEDVKAKKIVAHVKDKYGIDVKVSHKFITQGLERVNLIFLSSIYNANPYLEDLEEQIDLEIDAVMDADKKAIRNWMMSMLPDEEISDIYETISHGKLPIMILDKIKPDVVDWSMVKKKPRNNFERIGNSDEIIRATRKSFNLDLASSHALPIAEKEKKYVHDFFMMVITNHSLSILENITIGNKKLTEKEVFRWAKKSIKKVNENLSVTGAHSDAWKSGVALITLLAAIKPEVINWEYVTSENPNEDEKRQNISYALTIARKLGAIIFCGPEAILAGNSNMIVLFCIEIMRLSYNK